jgi:hypothetical protein
MRQVGHPLLLDDGRRSNIKRGGKKNLSRVFCQVSWWASDAFGLAAWRQNKEDSKPNSGVETIPSLERSPVPSSPSNHHAYAGEMNPPRTS